MSKKSENFFSNQLFSYDSYACHTAKDIENTAVGEAPVIKVKIQADTERPLHFAYSSDNGLIRAKSGGALIEGNILGDLLSLPDNNVDALMNFISRNGYFFPVSSSNYESVDAGKLLSVVNRIKATVRLMGLLAGRKNYQEIVHLMMYLLRAPEVEIDIPRTRNSYHTCAHPYSVHLKDALNLHITDREQESFSKGSFTVQDTIYTNGYEMDSTYYGNVRNGYADNPGEDDESYKSTVALYCELQNADLEERKVIDFIFHYEHEVGIVRDSDYINGVSYYSDPVLSRFTDSLKKALIEVARIVVGEEINNNLRGIYPVYDAYSMEPSWRIDSLMSAIYFSVFYMKPDVEIYRCCANPNCKREKYFLVKTTSSKKKYCCPECARAVAARNYRLRKMLQ